MSKPVKNSRKKIAIIGGGPAALYLLKEFVQKRPQDYTIDIFEAGNRPGSGMPYSSAGANAEHITNVSGNEVPELPVPFIDWIEHLPDSYVSRYEVDKDHFHDFKVVPRLLFGQYLQDQFNHLLSTAKRNGIKINVHLSTRVKDIIDKPAIDKVVIETRENRIYEFDTAIICTGHTWTCKKEGRVNGYYDSPYPPSKLKNHYNHAIAIKGSSLTAIDAVVTLAKANGRFIRKAPHQLIWTPNDESPEFKLVMHSLQGLMPAIRVHLDDPQLKEDILLSKKDIFEHIVANDGFLSLDWLFEKNFKEPMKTKDPEFFEQIRNMDIESFARSMMSKREKTDAIQLFKTEYREAAQSIRNEKPVYWKEFFGCL